MATEGSASICFPRLSFGALGWRLILIFVPLTIYRRTASSNMFVNAALLSDGISTIPAVASPRPAGMTTVVVGTTTLVGMSLDVLGTFPIVIASRAIFHFAASRTALVKMSARWLIGSMFSIAKAYS